MRNADSRREYRQERRECAREISQARREDWRRYNRYDWNRPAAGGYYYADQYYRDGRYYRERRLSRNDRIYRGNDGRYYCRRSDGTTGLIIGAGVGALIGNSLDNGRSSLLGTLIGGAAGAAIGSARSIVAACAAANRPAQVRKEGRPGDGAPFLLSAIAPKPRLNAG